MTAQNKESDLILSRDEVRAIDAAAISELGISGMLLMENAACGVSDVLLREFVIAEHPQRPTTVVCGPGNNGGDGLAVARQLLAYGLPVDILLVRGGKSLSPDANENLSILTRSGIKVTDVARLASLQICLAALTDSDVIVDCVLGTGIHGVAREPFSSVIQAINASPAQVLAVDVPSGLDCEQGTCSGSCIRAVRTVTFVGLKRGFLQQSAAEFTGGISVAHIGLPRSWVTNWLLINRS